MDDKDLPDELRATAVAVRELSPQEREDRQQKLETLSSIIARQRDDAVKARKDSGIEEVWSACEDAYLCIDDNNRPADRARWSKPTSMVGPVTSSQVRADNKSIAFVRLTARYVDMGAAKVSEIILPIDGKAFSLESTPIPDLVKLEQDETPVQGPDGQPVMAPPQQPGLAPVPLAVKDLVAMKVKQAQESAEKAEQRIYDWMVESKYPMQMRKVIHDSARLGVGILKGPFPEMTKAQSFSIADGVAKLDVMFKVSPKVKWISPWNLFPFRGCAEDIHSGDGVIERDFITASALKALKKERHQITGKPIYIADQIDKVLEEGPGKSRAEGRAPGDEAAKDEQFEIWYFYGSLKREDFMALEPSLDDDDLPDDLKEIFCIATIVNDTVISVAMNPMESGRFPYRVLPWSRRAGHWAGVGVAEQVSLAQRIVNAGTRRLLDNAGVSSGVQIVVDRRAVAPADGNWSVTPDKLWFITGEGVYDDVRKAFTSITIPNLGQQLAQIIQYGFKLAEEASNIPLVSQGQTGPQDPKTYGQAELQNNNANTILRNMAYGVDDHITEPLVNDFYEWLMMDPDVPEDEKGDFKINARGSIAMVEKAIHEQTLLMLGQMTLNPAFGLDPARWAEEYVRSKRMDPARIQLTDERKAELAAQPQMPPPQIAVAQIREQGAMQREQMRIQRDVQIAQARQQTDLQREQLRGRIALERAKVDTDRDTVYTEAMMRRDQISAVTRREELMLKREIAMLDAQVKRGINTETNKVKLAEAAMKLRMMRDMAFTNGKTVQTTTPPFEPPGQAPDGQAFTK